ncbi:MAG: hypothetical protein IJ927_03490 [Eubacterium sp.]|nr:hypothetical protein [Eubacterium sp.]
MRNFKALIKIVVFQCQIKALKAVIVQRSLQAGLNAHLTKPVKPEALFQTLEELIVE